MNSLVRDIGADGAEKNTVRLKKRYAIMVLSPIGPPYGGFSAEPMCRGIFNTRKEAEERLSTLKGHHVYIQPMFAL